MHFRAVVNYNVAWGRTPVCCSNCNRMHFQWPLLGLRASISMLFILFFFQGNCVLRHSRWCRHVISLHLFLTEWIFNWHEIVAIDFAVSFTLLLIDGCFIIRLQSCSAWVFRGKKCSVYLKIVQHTCTSAQHSLNHPEIMLWLTFDY